MKFNLILSIGFPAARKRFSITIPDDELDGLGVVERHVEIIRQAEQHAIENYIEINIDSEESE